MFKINCEKGCQTPVIKLLKEFKKEGCTIIMVTHDIQLAEECDRVIDLNGHS